MSILRKLRPTSFRRLIPGQKANGPWRQVAALPWRLSPKGVVEILLVTGRNSARWLVPKGWPMRGRTFAAAAAREAFEEAGVEGRVTETEAGRFRHSKRHRLIGRIDLAVHVYPLAVTRELEAWPEQDRRERLWLPADQAAALVASRGLGRIIRGFPRLVPVSLLRRRVAHGEPMPATAGECFPTD